VESTISELQAHLNWVDVGVLAVLIFSLIVGLIRGFFTQVAGIIGVIASILVALKLSPILSSWVISLSPEISTTTAEIGSFVGLIVLTLIIWFVLSHYLKKLLVKLDFGTMDRVLGAAFGLVKGALVAYVCLILIHGTLPKGWTVNQELLASKANRGVEFFDGVLKQQKQHIPLAAWQIIAKLRRFDEPAEEAGPSS
jgi:membrane protein required for colicin V production